MIPRITNLLFGVRAITLGPVLMLLLALSPQHELAAADKKEYRFNYFTSDDGLSQNTVDCILKDSRGFMWFGTWNGLNRFDGYNFKSFTTRDQEPGALNNNFIFDMDEDRFGNLWIGTAGGLQVYLYEEDRFIQYLHHPEDQNSLRSDKVNSVLTDNEGSIWIGTDRGLDKASIISGSGELDEWAHYQLSADGNTHSDLIIQTVYKDHSGRIWLGTNIGLGLLGNADSDFTLFTFQDENEFSLSNNDVQVIMQDNEGILWIGTNSGLNRFDYPTKRFLRYYHDLSDEQSLIHNSVQDITIDSNGDLVFGTLGGISVYLRDEDRFVNYTYNRQVDTELNNEFVNSLYADGDGNVWIGTDRGGINQYNVHQNEFKYIVHVPGNEQSLNSPTVNSVWEDEEALWVGNAGGGLNRIGRDDGLFMHFQEDASNPFSLSNDFVTSIHRDVKGNLLLGTWGGGMNLLSPEDARKGRFDQFTNDPENESSLVDNFVSSIVEDRFGIIWIGTFGGLTAYDPEKQTFIRPGSLSAAAGIKKIGCIDFDVYNNLWIGTENGLFMVPASQDNNLHLDFFHVEKYVHRADSKSSLSGNYVISMYDDSYGNLWFGTYGNGLNKLSVDSLNRETPGFVHYTELNGLCNNTIYGIQEDNSGNLWLSTDNGLTRFNIESERISNYNMEDGLLHNQFYWASSFRNSSGLIYFGSMKGLLCFSPEKIKDLSYEPGVILTNFKIYNQDVRVGAKYYDKVAIDKSISVADQIILTHKIKEFSLDFSALYYEHPDKVFYAYKMLGFDNDWRYVSSDRRYASYTNLKGGEYTFMVKSSLTKGSFDSPPLELKIMIVPPFWVQTWFIVLMTLLLAFSVMAYNRYRIYSLQKRQKELEVMVEERTKQIQGQNEQLERQNREILEQKNKLLELNRKVKLSNEQQMRFFTHISHEFKTPLTLIIAPLEQMIDEFSSRNPHHRSLVLIRRNAQRLLHLINQLMEVRRIKTGKSELRASKRDLVSFLEGITQSFYNLALQKKIIYEFNAYPGEIITYFDGDKVENMLYNLLSNAFKYTPDGGQIMVSLGIIAQKSFREGDVTIVGQNEQGLINIDQYAEISVTDTGYGIELQDLKKIFKRFFKIPISEAQDIHGTGIGLYLTKELIRTHKGQLYINSKKGEGTVFTILIPLGNKFLEVEEMIETGRGPGTIVPKLHADLLSRQIEQQRDTDQPPNSLSSSGIRTDSLVLVIDDDRDMLRFTADYLGESFRVITASNGNEGMEQALSKMPDLIISDIVMPGMDGLELCALLRSKIITSHIPVILLTSRSDVEETLEGLDYGALDYIAKPFDIKVLEAKVRNLISNRESLKRLYTSTQVEDLINVKKVKVHDQFLQRAIRSVEEEMGNPQYGVMQLAKELCVSRSLLHKKLISSVDQSAGSFINSIRMKKAALLLLENNLKVSQVAFEVGFNDPKYFSKIFKKHFGRTPTKFVEKGTIEG